MASKIASLTIVNTRKEYFVGHEYNGLLLHRIEDKTAEYQDSMVVIYMGFTKDGDIVFEAINAPICVAYKFVS